MQIIQLTPGGGGGGGVGWEEVQLQCLELNKSLSENKNANLIGI